MWRFVRTSDAWVSFSHPGNAVKSNMEETRVDFLVRASGRYLGTGEGNVQLRLQGVEL